MRTRINNPEIIVLWYVYRGDGIERISEMTGYSHCRIITHIKNLKNKTANSTLSALKQWFTQNTGKYQSTLASRVIIKKHSINRKINEISDNRFV